MPRIPYVPMDIAEPEDIVTFVRRRRGGGLLNLDRMLLHSPPLAKGWSSLMGELNGATLVSAKLREMVACVVSRLNGADYGVQQHEGPFLRAGGTSEQAQALSAPQAASENAVLFSADERAAIRLAIEMTSQVQVSEATFAALREALPSDRHVVELTMVAAAFNMVSRFLVALGVDLER